MKTKKKSGTGGSAKDKKEEIKIDMPDAGDIPGQEHIHVPPAGELADTTASSDDEEGRGVLDNPTDEELYSTTDEVRPDEKNALDDAANKVVSRDQRAIEDARVDQFDEDGEPLNERTDLDAGDLDVPGSELDDANEEIGEEDEENNPYSVDEENEDKDINTRR